MYQGLQNMFNTTKWVFKLIPALCWMSENTSPFWYLTCLNLQEILHGIITFGPKKYKEFASSCPPTNKFSYFTLDPNRPGIVWPPIVKLDPKCWQSEKCEFYINISLELSNTKKNWNVFLGTSMCSLQITTWHWTLIINPFLP